MGRIDPTGAEVSRPWKRIIGLRGLEDEASGAQHLQKPEVCKKKTTWKGNFSSVCLGVRRLQHVVTTTQRHFPCHPHSRRWRSGLLDRVATTMHEGP